MQNPGMKQERKILLLEVGKNKYRILPEFCVYLKKILHNKNKLPSYHAEHCDSLKSTEQKTKSILNI